jgi:hypothetical protein
VVEISRSVSIKAIKLSPETLEHAKREPLKLVRGGRGKYHGSNVLEWPKVDENESDKNDV